MYNLDMNELQERGNIWPTENSYYRHYMIQVVLEEVDRLGRNNFEAVGSEFILILAENIRNRVKNETFERALSFYDSYRNVLKFPYIEVLNVVCRVHNESRPEGLTACSLIDSINIQERTREIVDFVVFLGGCRKRVFLRCTVRICE